jgi:rare lipoprotein A
MLASPLPAATEGAAPQPLAVFSVDSQPLSARRKAKLVVRGRRLNVLTGRAATVTGTLRPHLGRVRVVLQALHGRTWVPLAHTLTGARGRFHLRYVPHGTGRWKVQVHVQGSAALTPTSTHLGKLGSYELAGASWYGGGGETACGSYLTSETMGVANKTLPCGTPVTIRYHGRTVTVDVIDRGPYVEGREFDLTEATKRALGFEGVADVWATR